MSYQSHNVWYDEDHEKKTEKKENEEKVTQNTTGTFLKHIKIKMRIIK